MAESVHARRAVRHAFDRAAASYDTAAGVQREICTRLGMLIETQPPLASPARLLDAGCGTGYGLDVLTRHFPAAQCIALDFAPAMLERARSRSAVSPLCADLQALPLADGSIDAVWSSLALQWCDPARAFAEFARVLSPGGTAWIATLGPATLHELRAAFTAVDAEEHVLHFRPPDDWIRMAESSGFGILSTQLEQTCVRAVDLRGVIAHLKSIGAHRVSSTARRPLRRSEWRVLEEAYETHRDHDGLLTATYDVILLALRRR